MKERERERLSELSDMLRCAARPPIALVVDDSREDLFLTTRSLETKGVTVYSAKDGQEAVALIPLHKFWVTFLDWKLFGFSGEETLKAIRQIDPASRVIILTGVFDPESSEAVKAMDLGAIAVMSKPLTDEQIDLIFGSP